MADPIAIAPDNLRLKGERGVLFSEFALERGKRGYHLMPAPIALEAEGGRYVWRRSNRGWAYMWSFVDPAKPRGEGVANPEELDALEVMTEDRQFVRFTRGEASACADLFDAES